MYDISKEAIEAIQKNVKDREEQHLGYKRENLFEGSWSDFVLEPSLPNLIENGWDDFEPYGSGKNYVENWDFSEGEKGWSNHISQSKVVDSKVVIDFSKSWGGIRQQVTCDPSKEYVLRAKVRVTSGEPADFRFQWDSRQTPLTTIEADNRWVVVEGVLTGQDGPLYVYQGKSSTNTLEIDWVSVSEKDNQHLVVEKTPLGNGLTRIQTWGGNNVVKYRATNMPMIKDKKYTDSIYIENLRDEFIVSTNTSWNFATIPKGFKGFVSATNTAALTGTTNFTFKGSKDTSLDFIASDPVIVEGNVPNPVMIVDTLDDGREHVRVFGATKDTKLVYRGDEGFKETGYRLQTNIENKGVGLSIKSSLSEEKQYLPKGRTEVDFEGELTDKLEIEIGAAND